MLRVPSPLARRKRCQEPFAAREGEAPAEPRLAGRLALPQKVPDTFFALALLCGVLGGCPPATPVSAPVFNNTTDATNGGASFIGSAACGACHPDIHGLTRTHGHTYALNRIDGTPPAYATEGTRAGVPDPPEGTTWQEISYVIGGYTKDALFVGTDGFILTDTVGGVPAQWNLAFPPNGTTAGFVPNAFDQPTPLPYELSCFRCHTVGAKRGQEPFVRSTRRAAARQKVPDPFSLSQDNRPGILGTWAEPGVQCEACHGPGSNHIPQPSARLLFVDSSAQLCGPCHTAGPDPNVILAADGFIAANTQYAELLASGGHSTFSCGFCHDPHASAVYDRGDGIRNPCTVCHADHGLALHAGIVFERGDYREPLACESCHMPLATKTASAATAASVGDTGRMGDTRTHIFRIDVRPTELTAFFTADGKSVVKDADGRAAVPLGFVCFRCHNNASTSNNSFPLELELASEIATDMHQKFDQFPTPFSGGGTE